MIETAAARRKFWHDQGARLKNLQVRPVPRSLAGGGARVAVTLAALSLSFSDMDADAPGAEFFFTANVANLVEHSWRASEFVLKRLPAPSFELLKGSVTFDNYVKGLAGAAAVISGIGSVCRAGALAEKGMTFASSLEYANATAAFSVALGQLMMTNTVSSSLVFCMRVGAVLNIWGVALAVAVLLVQIVIGDDSSTGVQPVLQGTLAHLRGIQDGFLQETTKERLAAATKACNHCQWFSVLHKYPGSSEDDPAGGSPTYWKAAKLGLSSESIKILFGANSFELWQAAGLERFLERA